MYLIYILKIFFPYILLFYLFDSFAYIKKKYVYYISHIGGDFNIKWPGIRFLSLSPIYRNYEAVLPRIFFTESCIYISKRYNLFTHYQKGNFKIIEFSKIKSFDAKNKSIHAYDNSVINLTHYEIEQEITNFIKLLIHSTGNDRTKLINQYNHKIASTKNIDTYFIEDSNYFISINILSLLLTLCLFIMLPGILYLDIYKFIDINIFLYFLLSVYVSLILLTFLMQNKFLRISKSKICLRTLPLLLSPVSALRACGHITREISPESDYLLMASRLLSKDNFANLVRKEIHLVNEYKINNQDDDLYKVIINREQFIIKLCNNRGVDYKEILNTREKHDPLSVSYCPVCESEYLNEISNCKDCNLRLIKFRA